MKNDYYKILWLSKSSSLDDIKKAYRKLAILYHPDKNKWSKETEEKMKLINEAYSVLGNEENKLKYDCNNNFSKVDNKSKNKNESNKKQVNIYRFDLSFKDFINGKEIIIDDKIIKSFVFKIPTWTKPFSVYEFSKSLNNQEDFYILLTLSTDYNIGLNSKFHDYYYWDNINYIKSLDINIIYQYINNYFENNFVVYNPNIYKIIEKGILIIIVIFYIWLNYNNYSLSSSFIINILIYIMMAFLIIFWIFLPLTFILDEIYFNYRTEIKNFNNDKIVWNLFKKEMWIIFNK